MGPKRFSVVAWGVLGYSLGVIVWGYFLRVSESGDGCGTDWPLCDGAIVPSAAEFPTWIEYTHRLSSGLALLLVVVMALWARSLFRHGHPVRTAAAASLFFTVTESLFGAILVILGWVAGDVSTGRILIRPFHVTNTFLLMASLGLMAWWAHRGVQRLPSFLEPPTRAVLPAGFALLLVAATGSWTGLAGTAFPVESVGEGIGQYLEPSHLLIYLRTVHPAVALITIILLFRMASVVRSSSGDPVARRLSAIVLFLAGIQLALGPLTIVLLHPTALRLVHLWTADLLWLSILFLGSTLAEGPGSTSERSYYRTGDSERSPREAATP